MTMREAKRLRPSGQQSDWVTSPTRKIQERAELHATPKRIAPRGAQEDPKLNLIDSKKKGEEG